MSLVNADAMHAAFLKIMYNASTLTRGKKAGLMRLCLDYQQVFNAEDKPLLATTLITFYLEPPATKKRFSVPPRPLSHVKRRVAAKIVRVGIRKGISTSSVSEWASAIVLVTKTNSQYRLCADYRPLNRVTKTPVCPLPNVYQALSTFQKKRILAKFLHIQFIKGNWQIPFIKKRVNV